MLVLYILFVFSYRKTEKKNNGIYSKSTKMVEDEHLPRFSSYIIFDGASIRSVFAFLLSLGVWLKMVRMDGGNFALL